MKRWEYLIKTSANPTGEATVNELDRLGESGWELVSVTYSDTTRNATLYFKKEAHT
jgi:hypothetical protein